MSNFKNPGRQETPPAERILARITKTDGDKGCWLFQGAIGTKGYGQIRTVNHSAPVADTVKRYRTRETHAVMFEQTHGEIPNGFMVIHSCRVRACCNPEHLWLTELTGPINYAALQRAA